LTIPAALRPGSPARMTDTGASPPACRPQRGAASAADTGSEYNTRLAAGRRSPPGSACFSAQRAGVSAHEPVHHAAEGRIRPEQLRGFLDPGDLPVRHRRVFAIVGRAVDRWACGACCYPRLLFGVAGMARGAVHAPWQLGLSFLVVSMASAMTSAVGYAKLVSLWFGANRGKVLSLVVALGAGLGSALTPQVVRLLIPRLRLARAYIQPGRVCAHTDLPLLSCWSRAAGSPGRAALPTAQ